MNFINPLFNDSAITKEKKQPAKVQPNKSDRIRATRKDKTHNIKFPVSSIIQMKLKSYCQQGKRLYMVEGKDPAALTQTKFNTYLLCFGLQYPHILHWDFEYKDTGKYMHTYILETEYHDHISDPHGLSDGCKHCIQKRQI